MTAAQLRVQKGKRSLRSPHLRPCTDNNPDLSELALGDTMKTTFPNPDDILNFTLTIDPDEGMYKGGSFIFTFAMNNNYPHDPPKVKCTQKIYHPNIDLEGNVCLNILREDWKPVLNLNAVIVGMQVCKRCNYLKCETNSSSSCSWNLMRQIPSIKRLPRIFEPTEKASDETHEQPWEAARSRVFRTIAYSDDLSHVQIHEL